jgi:NAD(P)-dependent dehydrogenase (short-subunit alcohol dehydrogenase family)
MHVLVIGAAGMVGRKLVARIVAEGGIGGRAVTRLSLVDVVAPEAPAGIETRAWAADLSAPGEAACMVGTRPDLIFHLAAIVSGEAEADFDKGYRINLDGTRFLFEAIRQEGLREAYAPRVVFTSSIATFGAPFPDAIPDEFHLTPLTSYGTQKAIGELLLADYSRRGIFDGIGIRLPTICIRPGKPNKAASGFFSGILREPLAGQPAVLPVPDTVMHWHASPGARSASSCMPRRSTPRRSARGGTSPCRAWPRRRRADRGAAPRRRRQGRGADPARAGRDGRPHRRRLAAPLRREARRGARLRRGDELRRDHPRPCRGRARGEGGVTKPGVLVAGELPAWDLEALAERFDVHLYYAAEDKAAMLARHRDTIRAIATKGEVGADAALMDALPKLEIIGCYGVGYDLIDVPAARARGIRVTNTPDVLTEEVADMAIGLLLAAARRIPAGDAWVRDGSWKAKGAMPLATRVWGKRLGIVGLGRIGSAIARRAEAFRMPVAYSARQRKDVPYDWHPTPCRARAACRRADGRRRRRCRDRGAW